MKAKNDIVAEAMPQPTPGDLAEENATLKGGLQALKMIALEQIEEIESLKESREAWVRKCEELTGQQEATKKEQKYYERRAQEGYFLYHEACDECKALRDHPWRNLWNHIKEALGIG